MSGAGRMNYQLQLKTWRGRTLAMIMALLIVTNQDAMANEPAGDAATEVASSRSLLDWVPKSTVAVLSTQPRRFFSSHWMERLPFDFLAREVEQKIGLDPRQIDRLIVFIDRPQHGWLYWGCLVDSSVPIDWQQLPASFVLRTEFGRLQGHAFRRGRSALDPCIYLPTPQRLVIASEQSLNDLETNTLPSRATHIVEALDGAMDKGLDLHLVIDMRELVARPSEQTAAAPTSIPVSLTNATLDAEGPLPDQAPLAEEAIVGLIDMCEVRIRCLDQMVIGCELTSQDEDSAERLRALIAQQVDVFRSSPGEDAATADEVLSPTPMANVTEDMRQWWHYTRRLGRSLPGPPSVRRQSNRVLVGVRASAADHGWMLSALTLLIEPSIHSLPVVVDSWQVSVRERQLADAVQSFQREAATASAPMKANDQLSWRVHVLPFLGEQELYAAFHLDEPWHSTHNRQLIKRMPTIFADRRVNDLRTSAHIVTTTAGTEEPSIVAEPIDRTDTAARQVRFLPVEAATIWTRPHLKDDRTSASTARPQ